MASVVKSIGINGLVGYTIDVEVKILGGATCMSIVGLGDQAVKEAKDRIESSFDQLGATFPKGKIVVNLSPSDIKKSGSYFDLAMVIGILMESGQLDPQVEAFEKIAFLGEIGLMGDLKVFNGLLPMAVAARLHGCKKLIVPRESVMEAKLVNGIEVFGFETLEAVIKWLEKRALYSPGEETAVPGEQRFAGDFKDVKGHAHLMRFVTAAAAGGHNLLLMGPPGCGKSMIAKRIPSILPNLDDDEMLEVMAIYSVTGLLKQQKILRERPFRAPHYNTSANAIIGGGANATPGEISLAHNGVLFLDELPEFSRQTLESLRQPLEDRVVTIARVRQTNTFPANFMLVAAMNPCPCGHHGNDRCQCSPFDIRRYRQRISGPILDRLDIQKFLGTVDFMKTELEVPSISSAEIKECVLKARKIQSERYKKIGRIRTNAQMESAEIIEYCQLDSEGTTVLQKAYERHRFSARTYHKILKIARTFADLEGSEHILKNHLVWALMARDLQKESDTQYIQRPGEIS